MCAHTHTHTQYFIYKISNKALMKGSNKDPGSSLLETLTFLRFEVILVEVRTPVSVSSVLEVLLLFFKVIIGSSKLRQQIRAYL